MQMSAQVNPAKIPPPPLASSAVPHSLTDDAFLGGRLHMLQPEKGYRAGIDAVFLAAAAMYLIGAALWLIIDPQKSLSHVKDLHAS